MQGSVHVSDPDVLSVIAENEWCARLPGTCQAHHRLLGYTHRQTLTVNQQEQQDRQSQSFHKCVLLTRISIRTTTGA